MPPATPSASGTLEKRAPSEAGSRGGGRRLRSVEWATLVLLAIVLAAVDLFTKAEAQAHLSVVPSHTVVVYPNVLNLTYRVNPGGPFSLLAGSPFSWLLGPLALLAIATVIWWLIRSPVHSRLEAVACAIIVGGAAGNLFDRFRYGAVRDFLELTCIRWPVFNLADVFICVGVGLLLLSLLSGSPLASTEDSRADGEKEPA